MDKKQREEIRAREKAATPGPWRWFGNTKMHDIYLATVGMGRRYVMDFVRWGMGSAQPRFQVYPPNRPPENAFSEGLMAKASGLVEYEVPYRKDFGRIKNADADFIAHAREDIPALLAALEEQEKVVGEVVAVMRRKAEEMHPDGHKSWVLARADRLEGVEGRG